MMFKDRRDAGKHLVPLLQQYATCANGIVIALPRGGVIVGAVIATALHLPLDIVCPRKIGAPSNPEYAIGAITETGEGIFSKEVIESLGVTKEYIAKAVATEKKVAQARLEQYRKGLPKRVLKNKVVIVVDDGVATGSTLFASIHSIRQEEPEAIIVAIPVAPPDTFEKIKSQVTEAFVVATPSSFHAVGQFYEVFDQTTDEEVVSILVNQSFNKIRGSQAAG